MKRLSLAILMTLFAVPAFGHSPDTLRRPAPATSWVSRGPTGGDIRGLVWNPKSPGVMYALSSSYPSQVFRSVTSGKNWVLAGIIDDMIYDLALDPIDSNTIYLLGEYYFYKSTDAGQTCEKSLILGWNTIAFRFAVHPGNSNIILVLGRLRNSLGVFKTIDGGVQWTFTKLPLAGLYPTGNDIAFAQGKPDYVYLCGSYYTNSGSKAAVFVSKNGGQSWANVTANAIFNRTGWDHAEAVHVDSKNAKKAWVGYYTGIALTTNGGVSWTTQPKGNIYSVTSITADAASSTTLYAAGLSGGAGSHTCFKSTDGGVNWKALASGLYGGGRCILAAGSCVFLTTETGIYKSLNGGVSWKRSHSGVLGADIEAMAVAPSSPSTLYAGLPGLPLIRTANTGGAWTFCGKFEGSTLVHDAAVDPSNPLDILVKPSG